MRHAVYQWSIFDISLLLISCYVKKLLTGQDLTKNSLYDLDLELSLSILACDTPSTNGVYYDISLLLISCYVKKLLTGQDLTKNSLYDLDLELSLPILVCDTSSSNGVYLK